MKKKCLFPFLLILSLMLSGCGQKVQDSPSDRLETDGSGGGVTQEGESSEVESSVTEMSGGMSGWQLL